MYEEHPVVVQPCDEDIKVWRYMDFTKLVSIIDSGCLYFTRADKFDDPFEGSSPKINVEARKKSHKEILDMVEEEGKEEIGKLLKKNEEINKKWRRYTAINCWHMNKYESAAMWKLYLESDKGIAIQSTYNNLKRSLIDEEKIFLGRVEYIDYEMEFINVSHGQITIQPFFYKRKSYEHEREVRALVQIMPLFENRIDLSKDTIEHGVKIKVDLETLIEKIYVAPSSPSWFADLLKAVIKRYRYNFEVIQSRLNEDPVF